MIICIAPYERFDDRGFRQELLSVERGGAELLEIIWVSPRSKHCADPINVYGDELTVWAE